MSHPLGFTWPKRLFTTKLSRISWVFIKFDRMNEWKSWVLDQGELVKEKDLVLFSQYPQHQGQCLAPGECPINAVEWSHTSQISHKSYLGQEAPNRHFTITDPDITDLKIRLIPIGVGKHRVVCMEEAIGEKAQTEGRTCSEVLMQQLPFHNDLGLCGRDATHLRMLERLS